MVILGTGLKTSTNCTAHKAHLSLGSPLNVAPCASKFTTCTRQKRTSCFDCFVATAVVPHRSWIYWNVEDKFNSIQHKLNIRTTVKKYLVKKPQWINVCSLREAFVSKNMLHHMMHVGLVSWEALLSKVLTGHLQQRSQREIISGGIYIHIVQCKMYTLHWMSCSQLS